MNKDDEIREELSDLWCKEITGQLKGSEKIRCLLYTSDAADEL